MDTEQCALCGHEQECYLYGEYKCNVCGQEYYYDENMRMALTEEQLNVLREHRSASGKSKTHPIQPVEVDGSGVLRFKRNAIVRYLVDWSHERGCGLNELARMNFTAEDWQQLAQLIGYSLSSYGDLSYVDDDAYKRASKMANRECD